MIDLAHVNVEPLEDILLATVTGEIDLSNAEQIFEQIREAGIDSGLKGLAVDFSGTSYMDSAGIRALFELTEQLRTRGCTVRCVVPEGSPLRRVMKLADAEQAVELDSSAEQTLAALRSVA